MTAAMLVLENGASFSGRGFGAAGERIGEVVFNTSMTGYQEVFSDPSYHGQIIAMTATHIGNVGANPTDDEAPAPHCSGVVVRSLAEVVSSHRAIESLDGYLVRHGIPGLEGIDTRALTRMLRDEGAMRAAITRDTAVEEVLARVRRAPPMTGQNLVPAVTCRSPYRVAEHIWRAPDASALSDARYRLLGGQSTAATGKRPHVVAYDLGMKRAIAAHLHTFGCDVTVVPANTTLDEVRGLRPDGVFLSNGPGDPAAVVEVISTVRHLLDANVPMFGICLGHQILALALGAKTYKLPFGHHGSNHPVLDLATGKVEITSQNHGFAVDESTMPAGVEVTHRSLYDGTVEGLVAPRQRAFGVQYHPEASAGPHDSGHLFGRFVRRIVDGERAW